MSHDLRISVRAEKSPAKIENKFAIQGGSKLEVFDEEGGKIYEGEFNSFTANFLKLLYGSMIGAGTAKAKDLSNTDIEMNSLPQSLLCISGGSNVLKFGVVVGTNTAVESPLDYVISAPASLTYGVTSISASSVSADSISVEISRQIGNSSGSAVSLKEVGIITGINDNDDSNVLIARDLLDITLDNNKKSVWRYTIRFNFNNNFGGLVQNFAEKIFGVQLTETASNPGWAPRRYFKSVVFQDKIWILGGRDSSSFYDDVWRSSDGITWEEVVQSGTKWIARASFACCVFEDKIWVMGGETNNGRKNDVWCSADGSAWESKGDADWGVRNDMACCVFENKIWIMGGYNYSMFQDVWCSPDGSTWESKGNAPWGVRSGAACCVFENKIWITGGYKSDWSSYSDIWNFDGTTWNKITDSAVFGGSVNAGLESITTGMILLKRSGIWGTINGNSWVKYRNSPEYSVENFACCAFEDKIWVLGGNRSNVFYSTVWNVKNITNLTTELLPGSSNSAFSATGTALGALIANGSGSGELVYGEMPGAATTEPSVSGNKTKMSIAREFTNNSGADITVREVGLFSGSDMLARLIFAQPVVIPNGESEVITIDLETEV